MDLNTKKITTMSDYIPKLLEYYPNIKKSDLEKIIKSFLMNMVWAVVNHLSIIIRNTKNKSSRKSLGSLLFMINGTSTYDSFKAYKTYIKLMTSKIRVFYTKQKKKYNGYYYFTLSDRQLAQLVKSMNVMVMRKRGRPCKQFTFEYLWLYKTFEECMLNIKRNKHIFRIIFPIDFGWKVFKRNYSIELDLFEYIYRLENGLLIPLIELEEKQDNNLFERRENYVWMKWIDKKEEEIKQNKNNG